ncbi:MAG: AraC family transcriptional regulator, partial [Ruminococcus sp.]|nr:AraC family transcriptional regulator [Ruminococcus sp.]
CIPADAAQNRIEAAKVIAEMFAAVSEEAFYGGHKYEVNELLSRISAARVCRPENTAGDIFVERLKAAVEKSPESPFDLDEMAKEALVSKYRFIGKFKAAAGLTPHRFIVQNRLRKARRLIAAGCSFTDTALSCGFFDQSHFIREFKNFTGITPGDYKRARSIVGERV